VQFSENYKGDLPLSGSINLWTLKTLNLARSGNYLDRLLEIYPAELPPERPLPNDIKSQIMNLYQGGKYEDLVVLLISLKDYPFPIEHPYAALLRHLKDSDRKKVLGCNPQVIRTLAEAIASLGLNNIVKGVERPKDINRMLGAKFKEWVNRKFRRQPFNVVGDPNQLLNCGSKEICIYAGTDKMIAEFIKNKLKLREPEEGFFNRDVIAKVRDVYIVGEARFLSTPGGSQTRDLGNVLDFVKKMEEIMRDMREVKVKVKGVALIDGIVWYYGEYIDKVKEVAVGDRVVMSALFLEEYLLDTFNKLSQPFR